MVFESTYYSLPASEFLSGIAIYLIFAFSSCFKTETGLDLYKLVLICPSVAGKHACSNKHSIQFRGHNYSVLNLPVTGLQFYLYSAQLTAVLSIDAQILSIARDKRRMSFIKKKSESYLAEKALN